MKGIVSFGHYVPHPHTLIAGEKAEFSHHYRGTAAPAADLERRTRFNPSLTQTWFGAVMKVIDNVTMLTNKVNI